MIITKTPFRVSFFGGGCDLPGYFVNKESLILSTTIDKYAYVNVRHLPKFFDYTNEIVYSKIEQVKNESEIIHPLVRKCMEMLDMHEMRVCYDADLPARTGLGTSSSFAVGMLNAFYALKAKYKDNKILSSDAILLERVLCKEAGGFQDQIAASFGGFNKITFKQNSFTKEELDLLSGVSTANLSEEERKEFSSKISKSYEVVKVDIEDDKKNRFKKNLLLYFTGIVRNSFEIQTDVSKSVRQVDKEKTMDEMNHLSHTALKFFESNKLSDLDEVGRLLDETWKLKRSISNRISNSTIDELYDKAIKNGALGGKLLGAGGGGFLLFYVPEEKQDEFRKSFANLLEIPFNFDEYGTKLIYNVPETDWDKGKWLNNFT